jgi:hypothetical protein
VEEIRSSIRLINPLAGSEAVIRLACRLAPAAVAELNRNLPTSFALADRPGTALRQEKMNRFELLVSSRPIGKASDVSGN